jgi:cell division protein FtsL
MYSKVLEKIKVVLGWIKKHKYIFVTLVFLAIILVIDDNSLISHMRNRAVIDDLETEIKSMEADSADIQTKLKLYTADNPEVIEDEARKRGLLLKNEDAYIIRKKK